MAIPIGELKARLTAEATQMKQEIATVKKGIADLGEEGKKAAINVRTLDDALGKTGSDKIMQLAKTLDNLTGQIDIQKKKLAELRQSYEATFDDTKKGKIHEQILKTEASILRLERAFDSNAIKLWEMEGGLKSVSQHSKQSEVSFNSLNSTLRQLGLGSDQIKKINQELKNTNPQLVQQQLKQVEAQLNAMGVDGKQALSIIKQELEQVAQESQQAVSKMDMFEQALKDIGLSAEQIKVVKRNLDTVDPTKADRQLEELSRVLKQLGVDSKHIEKINQELRETETESKKAGHGVQTLASGLTALGAGAATAKILSLTKTLSNEANQLANSYQGLSNVATKFNVDGSAAADLADKLADRWGLNKGIMSDVVKVYTSLNFTLEETEKIMTATADAAAFNRQAHLSWDEAIKQVAEGIKSGNSNLTDAAGITTNLSVMQDRYAKSLGTTAGKLTEAGKIQAAYNGMLEEGAIFAGNADTAMTGYTGTQAAFNSTLQEARTELGEAYLPVIEEIIEKITPLIRGFAEWVAANKDVVAGATAAGFALTSLVAVITTVITVVGALRIALDALKISLGPTGWVLLGISALATGVTAYSLAADAATESTWKFADSQEELNRKLNESPLKRSVEELKDLQADLENINSLIQKQTELQSKYNELIEQLGKVSSVDEHKATEAALREVGRELKETVNALGVLGITEENVERITELMNRKIEASTPALRELRMETLEQISAQENAVDEASKLASRYEELTSRTKLTKEQTEELTSVVHKLTSQYPELHTELDEQGRLMIVNEGIIRELIVAEEDSVNAMLDGERKKRETLLQTAQASLESAKTQLKALEAVANAYKQDITVPEFPSTLDSGSLGLRRKFTTGSASEAITANYQIPGAQTDIAQQEALINELQAELDALNNDTWRSLLNDSGAPGSRELFTAGTDKEKKAKSQRQKTAEELAREDYQNSLKYIQYKRDLNQMTEQQEIAALERLQKRYSKYGEIRTDTEVRIYKIKEQLAADEEKLREQNQKDVEKAEKERFAASSEWITQEERRMVLAGKSEEEISQMKLEAWSRVRSRYDKDSEYYKQADTQLYNLRVNIIKQQIKAEQDAAKERETLLKDTTKSTLDAIDKAKKAELAALDERRKAIQKFYDDQNEAIDDSERLKERNELIAEMEKYRYATSEKGQKHYLELQERLRKMDLDDQKRELDKQREQELEALDQQQQDIESYYDDLRDATSELTGDLTELYKLADDERLKSFIQTNELIKQEMANLQQALEASQATMASTSTSGITQSIIAQMQANSKAWHSADAAGKKRLETENQSLGAQLGATYQNGRWSLEGTPIYHNGGIAGEMNFRSQQELLPDEIVTILRRSEVILTPQQVGSLVSVSGTGTTVHIDKIIEVIEPVFEDGIDLRAFGQETGGAAAELIRKQLTGGG